MGNLKIKNLLLTGAGGKIGRSTLSELVKAGFSVRALEPRLLRTVMPSIRAIMQNIKNGAMSIFIYRIEKKHAVLADCVLMI